MAAWSILLWHKTIDMLEHGTDTCAIPKSPLFINCSKNAHADPMQLETTQKKRLRNPGTVTLKHDIHKNINLSQLNIKQTQRGSYLSFSKSLLAKISKKVKGLIKSCLGCLKPHPRMKVSENTADREMVTTSTEYSSSVPYARVGWWVGCFSLCFNSSFQCHLKFSKIMLQPRTQTSSAHACGWCIKLFDLKVCGHG